MRRRAWRDANGLKSWALSYDCSNTPSHFLDVHQETALASTLPPIPPRPDLIPGAWPPHEPTPRRRFPSWVVGSAVLTIVMMVGAVAASYVVRYDPSAHRDEYRFIDRDREGDPVRWNPCEPVHYVVNAAQAPPGSLEDVQEAVRRISAATGIAFA